MSSSEIELRVEKAQALFREGYNCSQSVFAACADIYGVTDESLALRIAASFGGGIGRMRLTCGAASGMFLLAGLHNGSDRSGDAEGKKENYALVQSLASDFKQEFGSMTCADLLGLSSVDGSPIPSARTEEYYKKRPCVEMVGEAVRMYLKRTQIDRNKE